MSRLTVDRLATLSLVVGLAASPVARAAGADPAAVPPAGSDVAGAPAGTAGGMTAATTPAVTAPGGTDTTDRASAAFLDRRIASLRERLRIAPAQEPAWTAVTDVMRANMRSLDAALAQRKAAFGSMNAVDDLRSFAGVTRLEADHIDRLVGPFQALYAEMSPSQRVTADRIFRHYADRAIRPRSGTAHG